MKHIITTLIAVLSITIVNAQSLNLKTESVEIDNLITFIADYFPATEKPKENTINLVKNTLFLIETTTKNFSQEDKIVLQQSFKLLSKRLTKEDTITIVVYSGQNGILLESISAKEIKRILYTLNDIKSNITKQHKDGITLAYKLAQEQFNEEEINTIVMVRNPKALTSKQPTVSSALAVTKTDTEPKPKNNAVLITAITLLPELISIIKD